MKEGEGKEKRMNPHVFSKMTPQSPLIVSVSRVFSLVATGATLSNK